MRVSTLLVLGCIVLWGLALAQAAYNFYDDFDITWGEGRARVLGEGDLLTVSLDRVSGSGFESKDEYLYGKIDMEIKLVPGNSAGTVTAYYFSSLGPLHDEIDLEFLGNVTGEPYILHTNVFTQGRGGREQQFYLWFDPTKDFHKYSISWTPQSIIFLVDGTPIRQYKNFQSRGVPYPAKQPMRIYASIWNADNWATRGGDEKIDWNQAPFTASFRNFNAVSCTNTSSTSCSGSTADSWLLQSLDGTALQSMKRVRQNYMVYDYCGDHKRFVRGIPGECFMS